jgi:hypothetical protein
VEARLTAEPATFRPRACDCDFCRKHGAAWVSDAQGSLLIRLAEPQARGTYRQGSGQAELVFCRHCGVLVAVLHHDGERLRGAVNVKVLAEREAFGAEQVVSPQQLPAGDKVKRWQSVWFPEVEVRVGG